MSRPLSVAIQRTESAPNDVERLLWSGVALMIREAIEEERESCAIAAESESPKCQEDCPCEECAMSRMIADAIRARK